MVTRGWRSGVLPAVAVLCLLTCSRGATLDDIWRSGETDFGARGVGRAERPLVANPPVERAKASGLLDCRRSLLHTPKELVDTSPEKALWDAASSGDAVGVRAALAAGADTETRQGALGDTPMTIAASRGHLEVLKALLAAGADAKAPDLEYGAPPLWWGAHERRLGVVQLLAEEGGDVNQTDADGISALEAAAHNGNLEIVEALLGAGADAQHGDDDGVTALHFSTVTIGNDSVGIVFALLSAGAQVEAAAKDGRTPLMWAAQFGNLEAARALLEGGAKVGREDGEGEAAADMVCRCMDSAADGSLLQCPEGGCEEEGARRALGELLRE